MIHSTQLPTRNRRLAALSHDDLARPQPHLEIVTRLRDVLAEPNKPIEHVYSIDEGIASVIAISPNGVDIIKAIRGHITVRDWVRLEEVAGDCYGAPEAESARCIGRRADAPRNSPV